MFNKGNQCDSPATKIKTKRLANFAVCTQYCEFLNGFTVVIVCQCVVCQIFCNKIH